MSSNNMADNQGPPTVKSQDQIMDKVYKEYLRKSGKLSRMNTMDLIEQLDIQVDSNNHVYGNNGAIRNNQELSLEEKQFLLAVDRGDIARVRLSLEETQIYLTSMNINCVDPLGRSALLIAIENENIEMMELLLRFDVELGDALLHAINEENVEAVEMLLNHQSNKKKDIMGFFGATVSDSFTPDITPIILAAHRDNYEIIKVLLDRGDRIPKPHDVQCSCKDCVLTSSEDILRHSRSRINAYRALSSPSLIALSSKDPILTAFELSWELKRLSKIENEFKTEYEELAMQCQNFAVDLLDQTRGSKELEIVLNHDTVGPVSETGEHMTLSRLKLALKYKQKHFVAHPNCQQLLASLWYEGLPGFRRWNIGAKFLVIFGFGLMFPLWSLLYMIIPKSRLSILLRKPFMKFISHAASYFTFLFLLILTSQRIESLITTNTNNSSVNKAEQRGAPPTIIEWMVMTWVAGLIWAEIKQLWHEGAREYIYDMWNVLDFVTNTLYVATITLRVIAYYRVNFVEDKEFANIPRSQWDAYDPNLIAEALFATANIFSTLKLVYIFTINPHLGPLQISLGRMVVDILKFAFIFLLVLFSFACGLNQLYWYYSSVRQQQCDKDPNIADCDNTSFANLFEIGQTLYWAIFGLVELNKTDLSVKNHKFTEIVGRTMFGSYNYVTIIVLFNMLIAMMNNSYQIIFNQADVEWKFARSKLWMSYFDEGRTLPAPFNIIPTPKTFWRILCWLKDLLCRCTPKHKKSRWQSIRNIVKKVHDREQRYQAVMRDLVKRYIMHRGRGGDDESVTVDDISEIKQDISAFRFELLEVFKNNGMKTPNTLASKKTGKKFGRRRSGMTLERLNKKSPSVETIQESDEATANKKSPLHVSSSESEVNNIRSRQIFSRSSNGDTTLNGVRSLIKKETSNGATPNGKIQDEGLGESFDQQSEYGEGGQKLPTKPPTKPNTGPEITLDAAALQNYDCEAGAKREVKPTDSPFTHRPAKRVTFLWQNLNEGEDPNAPIPETKEPYIYDGKKL